MAASVVSSDSVGDEARFVTFDLLARGLRALAPAPTRAGRVALIVARGQAGVRQTPHRVQLVPGAGVPGDARSRGATPDGEAQITVMQIDVAQLLANGQPLTLFGDNLFVDLDLSAANLPPGSRLKVGTAILVVTPKPHNGCKKFLARFGRDALRFVSTPALRARNLRGIYMRALEIGEVRVDDAIEVIGPAT